MKKTEVKRFAALYERHLKLLKLQGKSKSTIDAYSRAVRRIRDHYDCAPINRPRSNWKTTSAIWSNLIPGVR